MRIAIRCGCSVFRWALPLAFLFSLTSIVQVSSSQGLAERGNVGGYPWAAYTPDGGKIACTRDSGGVWYFAPATRTLTRVPDTVVGSISAGAFSRDGKLLALAGAARATQIAEIRRVSDGALVGAFSSRADHITSIALSPDHTLLALSGSLFQPSGSIGSSLEVWNVATGRRLYTRALPDDILEAITFSPDGRTIAGISYAHRHGASANTIMLLTARSGALTASRTLENQSSNALAYFPNGKMLAVAGRGGLDLLNARTLANTAAFAPQFTADCLAVAPGGRVVALGGRPLHTAESALLVDTVTGKLTIVRTSAQTVTSIDFSPDGSHLLVAGHDFSPHASRSGVLEVCNAATGYVAADLSRNEYVGPVALSPDGTRFMVRGRSPLHTTAAEIRSVAPGGASVGLETETSSIEALDFSPDGRMAAIGGTRIGQNGAYQPSLEIWTLANRNLHLILPTTLGDVACCKFSPDGSLLAATGFLSSEGDFTTVVEIWDTASGQLVRSLKSYSRDLTCLAFSPDGSRLAAAGMGGQQTRYAHACVVELWDLKDFSHLRTFEPSASREIGAIAFAPDGDTIATGGLRGDWLVRDGLVEIWNANTGRRMESIGVGQSPVDCVGYTPQGNTLIVATRQSLQIYLTEGYRLTKRFDMAAGTESSVALGPGGAPMLFRRRDGVNLTWKSPFAVPFTLKTEAIPASSDINVTLSLLKPAPAEGVTFVLSTDAPWIAEPATSTVTVPAGESKETVAVRVHAAVRPGQAIITAREGTAAHSVEVQVVKAVQAPGIKPIAPPAALPGDRRRSE